MTARQLCICAIAMGLWAAAAAAHGIGGAITWNREISRLVYDRCASCHRPEGSAFSMMTYLDAQPRANEIKAAVLSRRMPPWGAVRGFGSFRNDQSLTLEQVELVARWVDGGIRRGNNPAMLPKPPSFGPVQPGETGAVPGPEPELKPRPAYDSTSELATKVGRTDDHSLRVSGPVTLQRPVDLDGLMPEVVPSGRSMRIVARLPGRSIEPLVWLDGYDERFRHPFLLRKPLHLPAATIIDGVPPDAAIVLLQPASPSGPRF